MDYAFFHFDCRKGNLEMVKQMMESITFPPNLVNEKDSYGNTPLHYAEFEIAKFLVTNSPIPVLLNEKNSFGDTPLHNACYGRPELETIKFLISCGADCSIVNNKGETFLDCLTEGRRVEIQEFINQQKLLDDVKCPGD